MKSYTPCCIQPADPVFGNNIHGHQVGEIFSTLILLEIEISIWDLTWVLISMFEWAFDLNQPFATTVTANDTIWSGSKMCKVGVHMQARIEILQIAVCLLHQL